MTLARRLLALAGPFRGWALALAVAAVAIAATWVVQALAAAEVLARLFTGGSVTGPLALLGTAILTRAVLAIVREQLAVRAATVIGGRLRDRLLTHLAALGPGYVATAHSGSAQAMLTDAVDGLQNYYTRYLPVVTGAAVTVLAVVGYLLTVDVAVALCVLGVAAVIPTLPRLWDRLLAERGQAHWSAYSRLHARYVDAVQGLTTLKVLGAVPVHRARLDADAEHLYRSTMGAMRVSLVDTGLTTLGQGVGVGLATVVAAIHLRAGELTTRELFVVLLLAGVAFRPFRELTLAWHAGFLGISAAGDLEDCLTATPMADTGTAPAPTRAPRIELRGVTFTYPGREQPALRSVDLAVDAGSTVALVGRSGAGKTTVTALVQRWFDPDRGAVLLDGTDLRELSLAGLRSRVAVVSQEITLFTGSVADNLRLGTPDATDADLWSALDAASLGADVRALPAALDTPLGERGHALSGGQRQRLAIARALLVRAPVLLLDEATSAVDVEAEQAVQRTLAGLAWRPTTLVVAHRLSTVRAADRIVFLDDGRVREQGTHDALLAAGGGYADLVAAHTMAVSR